MSAGTGADAASTAVGSSTEPCDATRHLCGVDLRAVLAHLRVPGPAPRRRIDMSTPVSAARDLVVIGPPLDADVDFDVAFALVDVARLIVDCTVSTRCDGSGVVERRPGVEVLPFEPWHWAMLAAAEVRAVGVDPSAGADGLFELPARVVHVRPGLSPARSSFVVCHEVGHAVDRWLLGRRDESAGEDFADRFAGLAEAARPTSRLEIERLVALVAPAEAESELLDSTFAAEVMGRVRQVEWWRSFWGPA